MLQPNTWPKQLKEEQVHGSSQLEGTAHYVTENTEAGTWVGSFYSVATEIESSEC